MNPEAAATVVIAGGGQAAGAAILQLRQLAFAGRVVLLTEEDSPPYERPPLSKAFLLGDPAGFRAIVAGPQANESFRTGCALSRLDRGARVVRFGHETLPYDRLLIATGARARVLEVPGAALPGVHLLRTVAHASGLAASLEACAREGRTLLVVGGSWIGLEVACAARERGIPVVVAERGTRLCERTLPAATAERLRALHEEHGVVFRFDTHVAAFGGDGRVRSVTFAGGESIELGAAVIGIGVLPNVEPARAAGLQVRDGIVVDACGRSSDPAIYAAGDVAEAPCAWAGTCRRHETWATAQWQGAAAARQMLRDLARPDVDLPRKPAPWFWSDQYGRTLQVVGAPLRADAPPEVTEDGSGFLETFHAGGRLVGAAAMGHARAFRDLRRALDAAHG